jgi:hypothetical protein
MGHKSIISEVIDQVDEKLLSVIDDERLAENDGYMMRGEARLLFAGTGINGTEVIDDYLATCAVNFGKCVEESGDPVAALNRICLHVFLVGMRMGEVARNA